jgi:hypothetical protein
MGIRETLNQNPSITTGTTIGVIVLALAFIVYQLFSSGDGGSTVTQMYYTSDDGKTYFADEVTKAAPFDHDGQQAVRAYVYSCEGSSTEFVAYLERLTAEGKKKLEDARAKSAAGGSGNVDAQLLMLQSTLALEVKKPGDAKWVNSNSPEGEKIRRVTCPDGKGESPTIVLP